MLTVSSSALIKIYTLHRLRTHVVNMRESTLLYVGWIRGLFETIAIYLMMESVSALCYSNPGTHHFYSGSGLAKTRKTNKKTKMCHTVASNPGSARKQYSLARPMFTGVDSFVTKLLLDCNCCYIFVCTYL